MAHTQDNNRTVYNEIDSKEKKLLKSSFIFHYSKCKESPTFESMYVCMYVCIYVYNRECYKKFIAYSPIKVNLIYLLTLDFQTRNHQFMICFMFIGQLQFLHTREQ